MASIAFSSAPAIIRLDIREIFCLDIEILSALNVVDFSMNYVLSVNGGRKSGELGKNKAGLFYQIFAHACIIIRRTSQNTKDTIRKGEIMRSIIVTKTGGPEVLELRDAPIPDISDDLVLVRVKAAGINYLDIMQRMGLSGRPQPPFPQIETQCHRESRRMRNWQAM